jgi:putative addiction module CopG family antidote
MNITLKPPLRNFVDKQIKSGRYTSAENVMAAAIARLMQDDRDIDFSQGELRALVKKGEQDIARGAVLSMQQVRKHFRQRREVMVSKRPKKAS